MYAHQLLIESMVEIIKVVDSTRSVLVAYNIALALSAIGNVKIFIEHTPLRLELHFTSEQVMSEWPLASWWNVGPTC